MLTFDTKSVCSSSTATPTADLTGGELVEWLESPEGESWSQDEHLWVITESGRELKNYDGPSYSGLAQIKDDFCWTCNQGRECIGSTDSWDYSYTLHIDFDVVQEFFFTPEQVTEYYAVWSDTFEGQSMAECAEWIARGQAERDRIIAEALKGVDFFDGEYPF